MDLLQLRAVAIGALSCCLALPLAAHGGRYVGPPDLVPPNPGGSSGGRPPGPTTPGPTGPTTPGPTGPRTGGGAPPTGTPPGPRTGGSAPTAPGRPATTGIPIGTDVTTWDVWWEINKAPYLRLKQALRRPTVATGSDDFFLGDTRTRAVDRELATQRDAVEVVLPALRRAMAATDDRDITTACLVAMAKVGRNHPDFTLASLMLSELASGDQEVRETAALALGLAALPEAAHVDALLDLVGDTAAGRALCGGGEVDDRTRTFATYGLALLANADGELAGKRRALAALQPLLQRHASRNLRVAAVQAIGLLQPGGGPDAEALRGEALAALQQYFDADLGVGEQLMQAHCPAAIARLLRPGEPRALQFAARCGQLLDGRRSKRSLYVQQSCAQAIGQLLPPCAAEDAAGADGCRLLLDTWRGHTDAQTRSFALIALAQVGGDYPRKLLLGELVHANSLERPWVALALGVLAHEARAAAAQARTPVAGDALIGDALLDQFGKAKSPGVVGALAVAIGLCGHRPAAGALLAALADETRDDVAGYLCIGLSLLGDPRAVSPLKEILQTSTRKPELLRQAAVGLGLMGDRQATRLLLDLLGAGSGNLAQQAAISSALGFIGDRQCIGELVRILGDDGRLDLARAFAAAALGGIVDKDELPWNSRFGCGANYRAATETLTNGQSGILDIL